MTGSAPMQKQVRAFEVSEGAGVTVHRTIGTPSLQNLDPFLMLDHFGTDNPDDYIAGFPPHPHRGFVTFTYMIDGHMEHKDSMGNTGNLCPGAAQWMKAASGIIHSEMPKQEAGLMRGFQLWINLPADEKMSDPAYQEFSPAAFPLVTEGDVSVKVLMGEYQNVSAPIQESVTDVQYLDITLSNQAELSLPVKASHNSFVYVFEGEALMDGVEIPTHNLIALYEGHTQLQLKAKAEHARMVFVSGRPLGESIVQYGPFVMNTREEIDQAMADYNNGRLVQKKAQMITD